MTHYALIHYVLMHYALNHVVYELYKVILSLIMESGSYSPFAT